MKWNCKNCGREVISEPENRLCLECWWKELVEKIEINSETIRNFMEKHYFIYFGFSKDDDEDVINIGVQRKEISLLVPLVEKIIDYYPKEEKNYYWEGKYSEYSAFLSKLFQFAEKEKIKRIRSNWKAEKNSNNEILFKVDNLIIEKKTAEELEKEE